MQRRASGKTEVKSEQGNLTVMPENSLKSDKSYNQIFVENVKMINISFNW